MKTWVLCFRRRNALEWMIRSRSRSKAVRRGSDVSGRVLPRDSRDLLASGLRLSSSASRAVRSRRRSLPSMDRSWRMRRHRAGAAYAGQTSMGNRIPDERADRGGMPGATGNLTPDVADEDFIPAETRELTDPAAARQLTA